MRNPAPIPIRQTTMIDAMIVYGRLSENSANPMDDLGLETHGFGARSTAAHPGGMDVPGTRPFDASWFPGTAAGRRNPSWIHRSRRGARHAFKPLLEEPAQQRNDTINTFERTKTASATTSIARSQRYFLIMMPAPCCGN
jgi:hypothetical protein